MTPAVRLAAVTKSFEVPRLATIWAARDLSLVVPKGQSVGVIGTNGVGKTTLLRLIAGIVQPDSGRIERVARTVALIDLGAGFHPDLTGEENIDFACALIGLGRREVDASRHAIRDFAGLGNGIHKEVRHFSSGMLARLAFAIAVHAMPELLLIDEVLAVGDADFQLKCIARLEEMHSEGVTTLLVSHDLAAIAALSDRVVLLDGGELVDDGSPSQVISRYLGTPLDSSSNTMEAHIEVMSTGDAPVDIPLRIRFATTRRHPDATGRVEIGLPVHPAANVVEGLDGPMIFATADIEGPWSAMGDQVLDYRIRARGLPAGRFIIRLVISAPSENDSVTTAELVIPGPPPLSPQVVLRSSVEVRSVLDEAAT